MSFEEDGLRIYIVFVCSSRLQCHLETSFCREEACILDLAKVVDLYLQARKPIGSGEEVLFFAANFMTLPEPTDVLLELRFAGSNIRVATKSQRLDIALLVIESLKSILSR